MDSRASFADCLFMIIQHRGTAIQVSVFDPVSLEFEDLIYQAVNASC